MNTEPTRDEVDEALDEPRALLAADDFDLVVRPSGAGFDLEVVPTAGACADCLVPEALFRSIVVDALAARGVAVHEGRLTVTYPAVDADVH